MIGCGDNQSLQDSTHPAAQASLRRVFFKTIQTTPRALRPRIGKPSTKINFPDAGDVQSSVRTAAPIRVRPLQFSRRHIWMQSQDIDEVWTLGQEMLEATGLVLSPTVKIPTSPGHAARDS
jgi:hypothetical protein